MDTKDDVQMFDQLIDEKQNSLKEYLEQISLKTFDISWNGFPHTTKYFCWSGKYTCGILITNKIVWTHSIVIN